MAENVLLKELTVSALVPDVPEVDAVPDVPDVVVEAAVVVVVPEVPLDDDGELLPQPAAASAPITSTAAKAPVDFLRKGIPPGWNRRRAPSVGGPVSRDGLVSI
jgi:hypothetical protein